MKRHLVQSILSVALGILVFQSGCQSVPPQPAPDVSKYPSDPSLLPGKGPVSKWNKLPGVWDEREAEFARTAPEDQDAVVFLGDSITQRWHSLADAFPGVKTVNRGISGDTTRGVLYRLDANVLSLHPRAIVLLIGTNDIGAGATPSDVADNIKAILKAIRRDYPVIPVIVCEVMPSTEKQHRPAWKIEKLNSLIVKEMKHRRHVYLCNTWSIYAQPNGDCAQSEFPDMLHPNAEGYAKWAAALNPLFAKLDLQASN